MGAPAASKMDFTKAWGSTKAPAAMPQPSSRPRKNKAPSAAPSSDAVQGGGEAAPHLASSPTNLIRIHTLLSKLEASKLLRSACWQRRRCMLLPALSLNRQHQNLRNLRRR